MNINVLTKGTAVKGGVILLGGFDGLHVGHRQLLTRVKTYGLPVGVITILGGKGGEGLFTMEERADIFLQAGVDFVVELNFQTIKELSPAEFLAILAEELAPAAYVAGEDFRFGKNAAGDVETLKKCHHVRVEILPLLEISGEKVSATLVKRCVETGDVETANALLGQEFFVKGVVQRDRQVGRTIGFPTANIAYPAGKCALKNGVYETRIEVDGVSYRAITNYGARPTFQDCAIWTESYLDGFSGDLYGRTLTVKFVRYLRGVTKFDSVDELKQQLQTDLDSIRGSNGCGNV